MQERIGLHLHDHLLALAGDRDGLQLAHRVAGLAVHGAEGGEVVLAQQRLRGAMHGRRVQRQALPGQQLAAQRRAHRAVQQHIAIAARARRYRYVLLNRAVRPALGRQLLSWERLPLDAAAMHRAAQALLGENDFSAFRTVHCQARHPMRELQSIAVTRQGEQVIVEVQANAFLHHICLLYTSPSPRDRG